ncbi:MAG TPA: isoprenylcysteine carboxylmethyltransferase family protein [Gammaproteobacteria bacterium]|nr:isoprenylcysteine carboxylmethyltransferase family protein [Gammaproteobacteria bacterium]
MVTLGNFFFRFRTTISPFLLLFLLLPGPALVDDPFIAALVGLAIAALGQVVRATTIGLEYIVRGGRNHRVYADNLVTEGLFRHSRNPMYVGKFLMIFGAGFASNSWPALLGITIAYSFMYQAVTLAEEAYLRQKFGPAFDDYCRRVPRWLPRLSGLGETLSTSQFRWRRVLVKGYSEPLGWTLPIVAIGLYRMSQQAPLDERPYAAGTLIGVLGVTLTLSLVSGWLKKIRSPVLRVNDT